MSAAQGIAIVTGASGGMGQPTAVRLAAKGMALLLCDLHADRLEAVAAPLRAGGTEVMVLAADLASPNFPQQLLAAIDDREIGALVHTAGLSPSLAEAERIWDVNFNATRRLVDAICPRMAAGACAVLISSMSAYMIVKPEVDAAIKALLDGDASLVAPFIDTPRGAYPISKRAVIALVAREAAAFGARGARIASIAPGLIDTGMGRVEMSASEQTKMMLDRTPMRRQGLADEIASAAAFLCSPDASYITGCDIKVDGGTLAALGF